MTVSYLGSLSTAQLVPGASAALAASIADLEAQVTALATVTASASPGGITAMIALATSVIAALETALAAGVVPPTVSFQASGILALKAELEALLALQSILAAGGIHALQYQGRADDLGSEVGGAIGGLPGVQPSDASLGLVLLATTPAAIAALRAGFVV